MSPPSASTVASHAAPMAGHSVATMTLLNIAHALDHLVLLVFAAAVGTIAIEFGFASWEDLMPYAAGAFLLFGLGSIPAGRLGDLWGRRAMMLVYFFGIGSACMLAALTRNAWQLAAALTLIGTFAAIYHPVGIPMLVQGATRPGAVIGLNGLVGNLGIAAAAVLTGFIIKYFGWRMAFVVPGLVSIFLGFVFARVVPIETTAPAKRAPTQSEHSAGDLARIVLVLTLTSTCGSLIFNFTTNGNGELLAKRMQEVTLDPARLGLLLGLVYTVASFAQLIVGRAIDRYPLKRLFLGIVLMQIPLFALAVFAEGWMFYVLAIAFMAFVFGAIPFTDALIVRYVDDRMRSRVAGMRLAIALGVSSLAVWILGPLVKANGFSFLLGLLAAIAAVAAVAVGFLPAARAAKT
ncbi:MAG: MFS transporter [Betaproteobacteria bacterium]